MNSDGKEWYVAAPWGRIAVVAWGDCRSPPVLLCHGKLDSAATFRPLVELLPSQFYYIAFDLPGCGKSDWMPPGLPLSVHDLTYSLRVLVEHFRWKTFTFIGHSLGAFLGQHYAAAYPGRLARAVFLDPVPAYYTVEPEDISSWYYKFFVKYFGDSYHKHNAPRHTAPKYTREKALELVRKSRDLTPQAAETIIDRLTEPAGDNLYRFTFDQRMKIVTRPPQSAEHIERMYTSQTIPILTVLAQESIDRGSYSKVEFILDPSKYPRGNYRVHTVQGSHDVHLSHPERLAPIVARFLAPTASKL